MGTAGSADECMLRLPKTAKWKSWLTSSFLIDLHKHPSLINCQLSSFMTIIVVTFVGTMDIRPQNRRDVLSTQFTHKAFVASGVSKLRIPANQAKLRGDWPKVIFVSSNGLQEYNALNVKEA